MRVPEASVSQLTLVDRDLDELELGGTITWCLGRQSRVALFFRKLSSLSLHDRICLQISLIPVTEEGPSRSVGRKG